MSNEMNINQFHDKIQNWNADLEDAKSSTDSMLLREDWLLDFKAGEMESVAGSLFAGQEVVVPQMIERVEVSDRAQSQLAGRLGIPVRWIQDPEKCPPSLREIVFNWKFHYEDSKELLMRMNGGDLRAVLSDQYTPFDHLELVSAVYDALKINDMLEHVKVVKSHVGDEMSAYLIIPEINFDTGEDRPISDGGGTGGLIPAVYLSNSEVGSGSARIHGGLFRSYCTNGMIFGWQAESSFRITHRFKNKNQIALLANEAIAEAMKLSEKGAHRFMEAQHRKILPARLDSLVNMWGSKYGIGVERAENWLEAVTAQSGADQPTYADVINEATHMANRTESRQVREDLERMAGEMVFAELDPSFTGVSF